MSDDTEADDPTDEMALLKEAARADPSNELARRMVAEKYRASGHPDQAGRWGIGIDGWTTEIERDRLARMLSSSRVPRERAAEFLFLPIGGLPPAVDELYDGAVKDYNVLRPGQSVDDGGFGAVVSLLWGLCLLTGAVGFGVVVAMAVTHNSSSVVARTFVVLTMMAIAAAAAASSVYAAITEAKRWAFAWLAGSIVVSVIVVGMWATNWNHG